MEIGQRYWFKFDAIGTDGDHVHIFVGAALRYAPSNIMQIIKSITAKKHLENTLRLRNNCGVGIFGVRGGYIGTVGDGVTADIIKKYVEKQGTTEEKEGYGQMKLLDFQ
ncbi:MAG: transposase [Methanosarcinales archaeon]|nr:transposase [Methanosarcinales archaeon]